MTSTAGYTYSYDTDGRRVKKAAGSTGTAYFYNPGSDVLTESDLSGNIQNEYIFLNGQRLARRGDFSPTNFQDQSPGVLPMPEQK